MMDNKDKAEILIVKFLNGDINSQEEELLHEWLKESKGNEQLFLDYSRIWMADEDAEAALETFRRRIGVVQEDQHIIHSFRLKKTVFYTLISAAAIISIFFLSNLFLFNSPLEDSDILSQANSRIVDMNELEDVQLVLSEEKTLSLSEKESTIKYTSSEVVSVNEENEIPKKEIAQYNELITPLGKRSKLLLADGTEVHVNSKTRVIYPSKFAKNKREIYVDGEIFLNVAKDEKCPFIVKTKESNIRVLGTSFNVSSYNNEGLLEVVLVSGSVEVKHTDYKSEAYRLKPNDKLTFEGKETKIEHVDTDKYTSWIRGFYVFEKEQMSNIIAKIEKFYGVDISFDKDVARLTCSGKLDLKENIRQVMETLENTAPIICLTNSDNTYQIKKK